jgi:hypothetical protein
LYYSSQGKTKISSTGTTSPTNQPRKDHFHLYSLVSPFTLVSKASRGHNIRYGLSSLSSIPAGRGHLFLIHDDYYLFYQGCLVNGRGGRGDRNLDIYLVYKRSNTYSSEYVIRRCLQQHNDNRQAAFILSLLPECGCVF